MICALCNKTFSPDATHHECRRCALFGGCRKVKCPYCGYENPAEPRSLKWLKSLGKKKHDQSGS